MTTVQQVATVETIEANQATAAAPTVGRAIVNRKQLLAKLQTVRKVARNKSPNPTTIGVCVAIANGVLTLRANDFDNAIALGIAADCDGQGEAVAYAKLLTETVRDALGQTVTVTIDNGKLSIIADTSTSELPALEDKGGNKLSPSDLPAVPSIDWNSCFDIDAGQLCETLAALLPATDKESSRFTLDAVKIEATADGFDMVATDGRRLHHASGNHEGGEAFETWQASEVLLPSSAIKALLSALKSSADVVTVALGTNQLQFSAPGVCLVSRMLEGRFPRWRDVITSRDQFVTVELSAADLTKAAKAAKAWTNEDCCGVIFEVTADGLSLLSNLKDDPSRATVASSASFKAAPVVDDEPLQTVPITLDPRFLIDFTSKLPRKARLSMELVDGNTVAYLRSGNYTAAVMPLAR